MSNTLIHSPRSKIKYKNTFRTIKTQFNRGNRKPKRKVV
jgi:hypothetical protein